MKTIIEDENILLIANVFREAKKNKMEVRSFTIDVDSGDVTAYTMGNKAACITYEIINPISEK